MINKNWTKRSTRRLAVPSGAKQHEIPDFRVSQDLLLSVPKNLMNRMERVPPVKLRFCTHLKPSIITNHHTFYRFYSLYHDCMYSIIHDFTIFFTPKSKCTHRCTCATNDDRPSSSSSSKPRNSGLDSSSLAVPASHDSPHSRSSAPFDSWPG